MERPVGRVGSDDGSSRRVFAGTAVGMVAGIAAIEGMVLPLACTIHTDAIVVGEGVGGAVGVVWLKLLVLMLALPVDVS